MVIDNTFSASEYIVECSGAKDSDIDLVRLAFAMVYDDHKGLFFDRYFNHIDNICKGVASRYEQFLGAGSEDDAATCLASIKHIFIDEHGYLPDDNDAEVSESFDLVRVIERRKGSSVALCLICIEAGRRLGWQMSGINIPSRFLCRMEHMGQVIIFDPSNMCQILQAHHLRDIVKQGVGQDAELSKDYLEPLGARSIIMHLCSPIKFRRIEMGEYERALLMVKKMQSLVLDEYRLFLDAGVLFAKTEKYEEARDCFRKYIDKAESYYDKEKVRMFLLDIEGL